MKEIFISQNFSNKGVSFRQWLDGIKFYGNHDDDVIIVMSNNQVFYTANSKKHFDELNEVISKLGEEL